MKYCSVCGSEMPDGTNICPVCGSENLGVAFAGGVGTNDTMGNTQSAPKGNTSNEDDFMSMMGFASTGTSSNEAPRPKVDSRPQSEPKPPMPPVQEEPTIPQKAMEPPVAQQRQAAPEPPQPVPSPVAASTTKQKKAGMPSWGIVTIIAGILIVGGLVGGLLYRNNVYLPAKRDAEAPRYYVMAHNINMRSTPEFGAEYNKLTSFPYGTELLIYDSMKNATTPYFYGKYAPKDARGKVMKDKCVEGYMAYEYMLPKSDFFLLNSIFGNEDALKMLSETRYKKALLSYFKDKGYRGNIDKAKMDECGIRGLDNAPRWQVFCRYEKAKSNNVYRSRKYRKDSKYTDVAIIIQNLENGTRRLLYFVFDDSGTPFLLAEQSAPSEGYMKDRTLKLYNNIYNGRYEVSVDYE